jgi:hypothetical protein
VSAWLNTTEIVTSDTTVLLPCATITATAPFIVGPGTHGVRIAGCGYLAGTGTSGSQGGTTWVYTGSTRAFEIGDPTYAQDTDGAELSDLSIVTSGAGSTAMAVAIYRAQDLFVHDLIINGSWSSSQIGLYLDGSGNYTGGEFRNIKIENEGVALWMSGHLDGAVTDDYANASTFTRLHIVCPGVQGQPIAGTYGIDILGGDGNTFSGGDVEGCDTVLHLGTHATANTFTGLRWENSNSEVAADAGSSYNVLLTGSTLHTGKLADSGTRNTFYDGFHHSINSLNGDWTLTQADATITNHIRAGIAVGNERGYQWELQTDYGNRWQWGFGDATSGEQIYSVTDLFNNVPRIAVQQFNNGSSSTNPYTAVNAAGSGQVCFNCSTNSGTGGAAFASGGSNPAVVASVDAAGNATFNGTLGVAAQATFKSNVYLKNQADADLSLYLQPGATANHSGALGFKDYSGATHWFLIGDSSNNFVINSAVASLDAFKAYESSNTGDTYVGATKAAGVLRFNYQTGSGTSIKMYGGGSSALYFSMTAANSFQWPGYATTSGRACLDIDTSGNLHTTGYDCGSSSSAGTVTEVKLTAPTDFTLTGCDITTSGTCAVTWANSVGPAHATLADTATSATSAASATSATSAASAASTPTQCTGNNFATGVSAAGFAANCSQVQYSNLGGAVPTWNQSTSGNAATATKLAANTLGCLDGWDHLPCTVYLETNVSESTGSGSYATLFTTAAAGIYRVTGYTYSTSTGTCTNGGSACTMTTIQYAKATQTGGTASGAIVSSWQVGSNATAQSSGSNFSLTFNLASGVAIQTETLLSMTSGATQTVAATWSRAVQIERIQ